MAGDGGSGTPIVVDSAAVRPLLSRGQALLGVARSSLYYRSKEPSGENLALMQAMDRQYLWSPRTSRPAGAGAPGLSLSVGKDQSYPANQAWAADITYLPMARGFLYLLTIMDWHSRYVVAWRLSNSLEADFCVATLKEALG